MDFKNIRLNDEQAKAVKKIDGALLVLAGPGTGKTQLLSARVAYILQNTDTDARSILCLTFTNKASLNMKQRILDLTDGKARDVTVKTFHSFASEIMNMYPDYFWNGARLSTVPDAVMQEIIENILSKLPLDNPLALKFYGKFTGTKDVIKALQLAKDAGLTPENLKKIINYNIQYLDKVEPYLVETLSETLSYKKLQSIKEKIDNLPDQVIDERLSPLLPLSNIIKESFSHAISLDEATGKTKNVGDWKRRIIQTVAGKKAMFDERRRNEWWLRLAEVYEDYRNQLHQRGYYDYSDMMIEVITQLENNDELRASVQERFLYVMIDEFQDTNTAQLKLAHLVSDHFSQEGNPNIMAVGDDDQSIFKFNGAELNNMLHFTKVYKQAETIILKNNYRSQQEILDLSSKIIEQADDRLVKRRPELDKKLVSKVERHHPEITHRHYKSQEEQLYDIAKEIAKSYSSDQTTAVIARGHSSLMRVANYLLELNIPLNYEQQRNILDHPLIEQTYNLSQICFGISSGDIETVNVFLARSLKHPMWGISSNELWQMAIDNYKNSDWLGTLEKNYPEYANFLLELARIIDQSDLNVGFEYLIGLRDIESKKSPIYEHWVKEKNTDMNEYLYGLSAIKTLRSLVNEFSENKNASVVDFVNFVILEKNNGSIINDESPFVTGEKAVNLLSVHKSKGLEFDNVYIIDAIEENWRPRSNNRKPPMNLPLQPPLEDLDDYIRLLFVAITRAKSKLIISSFNTSISGKETMPTPLINSILPGKETISDSPIIEILEKSISWPRLQINDEKALLKSRLENYVLSVTNLFNFLDVSVGGPNLFLERNLLRLPEVKTTSLAFGSAMHASLESAQKYVNNHDFQLNKVKDQYQKALAKEHLTYTDYVRYKDHGYKLLDKLFNEDYLKLSEGSLPEQDLNDVFIGDARLGGKLDRIDTIDNQIIVSDYKTGSPLSSFYTKSENLQIKAWKQRTQLIFYALLVENSSRFKLSGQEIVGQMIYLEADSPKDFVRQYAPSREEIDDLKNLVQIVYKKIINLDLPDTSKYEKSYKGIQDFINDLIK